jgi:hypothetical protein
MVYGHPKNKKRGLVVVVLTQRLDSKTCLCFKWTQRILNGLNASDRRSAAEIQIFD